jgi:transposase, IS5 family
MQMSFGTLELAERLQRDSILMKIDALIDWEALRPCLGVYTRGMTWSSKTARSNAYSE